MVPETENLDLSIYIHWPFCQSKCPYCDFNSHVRQNPIDQGEFVKSYLRELDFIAQNCDYQNVRSIFFGGGTPSLMSPRTVGNILDHIAKKLVSESTN